MKLEFHIQWWVLLCSPNFMAGESNNTQFMMGNSGYMVGWVPTVKSSVSTQDPVKGQELFLKRKVVICKGWQVFFSKTLRIWLATHLQGPPRAPSSIPVCQDSLSHHGRPGSCGPNGRAACTAAWTDAEPSLVLSHTQNKNLFRSLSKWGGGNTSQEEYATSKMQREPLGAVPQFWLVEGPKEQLILYLRHEVFWHAHTTWALEVSLR